MKSPHKPIRGTDSLINPRSRKSKIIIILIFTLIHLALTYLFFFWSFSVVMGYSSQDKPLSAAGVVLVQISDFFQWPLTISLAKNEFLRSNLPNYFLFIVMLLNSLLWGCAALGIILGVRSIQHSKYRYRK